MGLDPINTPGAFKKRSTSSFSASFKVRRTVNKKTDGSSWSMPHLQLLCFPYSVF